jgi:hypothetical protein
MLLDPGAATARAWLQACGSWCRFSGWHGGKHCGSLTQSACARAPLGMVTSTVASPLASNTDSVCGLYVAFEHFVEFHFI